MLSSSEKITYKQFKRLPKGCYNTVAAGENSDNIAWIWEFQQYLLNAEAQYGS